MLQKQESIMTEDGFSMVTKQSKLCARSKRKKVDLRYQPSSSASPSEDISVENILENIRESITMLEASTDFESVLDVTQGAAQDFKETADKRHRVHGTGSVETSVIAIGHDWTQMALNPVCVAAGSCFLR